MFALQITVMALEIAVEDPAYESIAVQSYSQFLANRKHAWRPHGRGRIHLGRG